MKSVGTKNSGAGSDRVVLATLFFCICAFNFILLWAQRDKLAFGWADFRSSYSEGILYRENPAARMYDYSLQAEIQNRLFSEVSTPGIALAYDHPPYELGIFLPFSYLPYEAAYYAWVALTLILAVIAGILAAKNLPHLSGYWKPFAVSLIVAAYPFLMLIRQGQDTALALILLAAAWLRLRRESESGAGYFLGAGLFKFQLFIPLGLLLAIWRPKILKGFTISGAIVTILSIAMVGPSGVTSYVSLLLRMAGNSTAAASEQYAMDARSMPNLRGLVYGIASGGGGAVPAGLAKMVPIIIAVASFAIFAGAAVVLYRVRRNSGEIVDLIFAAALTVALVVSFHLQMHDLTLLALPFALTLNWILGRSGEAGKRNWIYIALMASFYVMPFALLLTRYRMLCLYGAVLIALAALNLRYVAREPFSRKVAAQN
jgi:hypothetical protein